jgi:hypothetical protein
VRVEQVAEVGHNRHVQESTDREEPLERFTPTSGLLAGWSGLAIGVLVVGYVVLAEHSVLGLRVALGAVFAGVLVWCTQLRPRVTAYQDALTLHGTVSDVAVPYLAVDEVTMGQTLNVWAGGRRYVCVGIGKQVGFDTRQRMRAQRSSGLLGDNRISAITGSGLPRDTSPTYQSFVLSRIGDLVAAARQQPRDRSAAVPPVRTTYAVPELVALVVTGAAFLVSLFL